MREKAEEINLVLLAPDVDLWKLRELALSDGGLVNGKISLRILSHLPIVHFPYRRCCYTGLTSRHPAASSLAKAGRSD
jgi:hypothetical protein